MSFALSTLALVVYETQLPPLWGYDREWQLEAACKDADPELFYPELGGSTKAAK